MARLTAPPRLLHPERTERQKLPYSGTPHPTATRFFCARIPSGAFPCPVSTPGGGGNKPFAGEYRPPSVCGSEPPGAPVPGASPIQKHTGGRHGC
jgi:hypothetical protein